MKVSTKKNQKPSFLSLIVVNPLGLQDDVEGIPLVRRISVSCFSCLLLEDLKYKGVWFTRPATSRLHEIFSEPSELGGHAAKRALRSTFVSRHIREL